MTTCTTFFRDFFRAKQPSKSFKMPSWIPSLPQPTIPYNLSSPSYQQITKIVRRMKACGSPCPLDKLSVIPFKRCPYLRTYLTELFSLLWNSGEIPMSWKRACTVLVHKKGDTSDPSNFRPITLESVPLKIFTSCVRDSMFSYLSSNNYLEHKIQKGFLPKLSGTFEHTAQMAHVINKARVKQRYLVITLLDLKNAFGEVHHNLIPEVLKYHDIPLHIQTIIGNLYSNFHTSIITKSFKTPFLKVGRGVLQGDCLSPLTFNLCFNTFIRYISDPKFTQFGFSISSLNPLHWFQFADDAAVITSLEHENQLLLNHFSRWCNWADMTIRVDKCSSFGIKKSSTSSVQFLPKLIINHDLVPTVNIGSSFKYLGRYFSFSMDNVEHRSMLLETINDLLCTIDKIPCHPKNKLLLYHRYVLSKISWHLTIADLSTTWVIENLDNKVADYVRRWFELPISATLSTLIISKSNYGLSLILPSTKFIQCQTIIRNALKSSPNSDIKALWQDSNTFTTTQYDQYRNAKQVLKSTQTHHHHRITSELTSQGLVILSVFKYASKVTTSIWSNVQQKLPKNIFNFSLKYLTNTLATRKNLSKWSLSQSSACSFCLQSETLQHIVSSCKMYLEHGRYTWRHDSVQNSIDKTFSTLPDCSLYADLPTFLSPSFITGSAFRPDLLIITKENVLYILELTIGFETNIQINSERKASKYHPLQRTLLTNYKQIKFVNLSMGALGTIGSSSESFIDLLKSLGCNDKVQKHILSNLINITIRSTYFIFCCRNKPWTSPDLLNL